MLSYPLLEELTYFQKINLNQVILHCFIIKINYLVCLLQTQVNQFTIPFHKIHFFQYLLFFIQLIQDPLPTLFLQSFLTYFQVLLKVLQSFNDLKHHKQQTSREAYDKYWTVFLVVLKVCLINLNQLYMILHL